jgi:hypothetical protein
MIKGTSETSAIAFADLVSFVRERAQSSFRMSWRRKSKSCRDDARVSAARPVIRSDIEMGTEKDAVLRRASGP